MKKQTIGILGYGEIGKAIAKFYKSPQIQDFSCNKKFKKDIDILHICIPYTSYFVTCVNEIIKQHNVKIVINHSSCAVGTTKKLDCKLTVHSPVRGVHPNLHKGIKTFEKFIGADFVGAGRVVYEHFKKIGIKGLIVRGSETTEALKLWDTTQYGFNICLNKQIKQWCDEHKLNFDIIYTLANQTYNEGYKKLGRPEVARPYLKYMPGKIGGHCVIPNCHLLDDEVAKFILEFNDNLNG